MRWPTFVLAFAGSIFLAEAASAATRPKAPPPKLIAVGDIASCESSGDEATATLVDGLAGEIAVLGDLAYDDGTAEEFASCYDPSWGRHKARTRPVPGNHEYNTDGAEPYYDYFGAAAGDPSRGWYSYELGGWHVVALNSNCADIGGCERDSEQGRWLAADLAAHPSLCTLAYWHHPRFSSNQHGSDETTRDLWAILDEHDADLVLAGHDHDYERFGAQDADGNADPFGLRSFVVGTGGRSLRAFSSVEPNSEVRNATAYGVLELTLRSGAYDWRFVPVAGKTFTDSGSDACVAPTCGLGAPAMAFFPPFLWVTRKRRGERA